MGSWVVDTLNAEMQRMADVINELSKKVQQLEKEVTSMKIDMI